MTVFRTFQDQYIYIHDCIKEALQQGMSRRYQPVESPTPDEEEEPEEKEPIYENTNGKSLRSYIWQPPVSPVTPLLPVMCFEYTESTKTLSTLSPNATCPLANYGGSLLYTASFPLLHCPHLRHVMTSITP